MAVLATVGRFRRSLAALVVAALLAGCGSPDLNDAPVTVVDLSGDWTLLREALESALVDAEGRPENRRGDRPRGAPQRPDGSLNLPLAARADRLRIEQGDDYTRINYGDVRIREYNWGSRNKRANVETGWLEGGFEIRSEGRGRQRIYERYEIQGRHLIQYVEVRGAPDFSDRRVFERSTDSGAFHERR